MKSIRLWMGLQFSTRLAGLVLALGGLAAESQALAPSHFLTSTNNGAVTIVRYLGYSYTAIVPPTYNGFPVVAIGNEAFNFTNITGAQILVNTVTNIGSYVFQHCTALTDVALSDSIQAIGDSSFYNCFALRSMKLPKSLKKINTGLFLYCTNLTTVTMSNAVTRIEDSAFYGCKNLSGLTLSTNLTLIGAAAFLECSEINSMLLPNSLTNIGESAFYLSGLTGITIPRYVQTIGPAAFAACPKLTGIAVHASNTRYASAGGVLFDKSFTRLLQCPAHLGATSYAIPATVTNVAGSAFDGCKGLTALTIPKGVVSIGGSAFRECSGLTSVSLPTSLKTLGAFTFQSCLNLTNVVIASGPTTLPDFMFNNCPKLERVSIPSSVVSLNQGAFGDCLKLASLVLPGSVTNLGSVLFAGDSKLKYLYCLGAPPHVADDTFYNASNVTVYYFAGTPGWGATLGGRPAVAMKPIPVIMDKSTVSVPEGATASLQIKLGAKPVADTVVTAAKTGGDPDLTVSGGSTFTFTPANWNTYRTVLLRDAEDNGDKVNGSATFSFTGPGVSNTVITTTEADDDYTLTVVSPFSSVTVIPDQALYDAGTAVTLTALPVPALTFTGWRGSVLTATNPLALTVTANLHIEASYVPDAPVILPPDYVYSNRFTARWRWPADGAPEGELDVATDAAFSFPVPGYDNRYVVNFAAVPVTNLVSNQAYWYRVRRILPDGMPGPWSAAVKVRTGANPTFFRFLLGDAPVSKGVTQRLLVPALKSGNGTLAVKSSNPIAVLPTLQGQDLLLRYGWGDTSRTARITLTVKDPATGYKLSYRATLTRARGSVFLASVGALTNTAAGAAQELTLENRTGVPIEGIRVRALGLDQAAWLLNQTGLDPVTQAAIVERPCVLQPGSQAVVRLEYAAAYKTQAQTRPAAYKAWAILTPLNNTDPIPLELSGVTKRRYDGLWLLGVPSIRNRMYMVLQSDNGGGTWATNNPYIRATSKTFMFMDLDEAAPDGRQYRFLDQGL